MVGGWWRLAVGGWRLAVGGWRLVAVGGPVGGPLGLSLRAVLRKKIGVAKDSPASNIALLRPHETHPRPPPPWGLEGPFLCCTRLLCSDMFFYHDSLCSITVLCLGTLLRSASPYGGVSLCRNPFDCCGPLHGSAFLRSLQHGESRGQVHQRLQPP